MIKYSEAIALLEALARECPLGTEDIPLEDASGRVCSCDIFSREEIPAFHNSAMDGFALSSQDTLGATKDHPILLPVAARIAAGDDVAAGFAHDVRAVEIMTGASVPEGFDAVAKIEDTEPHFDAKGNTDYIYVRAFVPKGNNIREKGSDYKAGQIVLKAGAVIGAESMMALAALGIAQISVLKKPVAALLSTGKELVRFDEKNLAAGMIRNSTAVYLRAALAELGVKLSQVTAVGDETTVFKDHMQKLLTQEVDVVVTTGAVSMGKFDFIVPCLKELAAEIIFHKVAIRPGKPVLVAKIPRPGRRPLIVFGMPGNPVSTAVALRFFLSPYLRVLKGQKPERGLPVKLAQVTAKPAGLKCFFKARLEHGESGLRVRSLPGQASFMVSSLVQANAWVLFSEAGDKVERNQEVFVFPLLAGQSIEVGASL